MAVLLNTERRKKFVAFKNTHCRLSTPFVEHAGYQAGDKIIIGLDNGDVLIGKSDSEEGNTLTDRNLVISTAIKSVGLDGRYYLDEDKPESKFNMKMYRLTRKHQQELYEYYQDVKEESEMEEEQFYTGAS